MAACRGATVQLLANVVIRINCRASRNYGGQRGFVISSSVYIRRVRPRGAIHDQSIISTRAFDCAPHAHTPSPRFTFSLGHFVRRIAAEHATALASIMQNTPHILFARLFLENNNGRPPPATPTLIRESRETSPPGIFGLQKRPSYDSRTLKREYSKLYSSSRRLNY